MILDVSELALCSITDRFSSNMSSSQSKRKRLNSKSLPSSRTQPESRELLHSHASENFPGLDGMDDDYDPEADIDAEDPPPMDSPAVLLNENEENEATPSNTVESQPKKGRKKMKKRGQYWPTFKEIFDSEGVLARAECKFCFTSFAAHPRVNGTTNLVNHWKKCEKNPANQSRGTTQMTLNLQNVDAAGNRIAISSVLDLGEVRRKLCRLVIGEELPFNFVQKFLFRDLFASACPTFTVPSRSTVSRDACKMYVEERERLKLFLQDNCQRVCLTTDTWTSNQTLNYMALTAHFIDNDWTLQRRILNFCTISGHKAEEIATDVEDCLRSWDLINKIFTVTVDNASANDVACKKLQALVSTSSNCINGGDNLHVRCSAHIANLIVKAGLKEQIDCIDKVRTVVKFVRSSPSRMGRFKEECRKLKIDSKCTLVPDVPTRWNYTYVMLDVALKFKEVFGRLDTPTNDDGVQIGKVTEDEWAKIEVIVVFLKEFYNLTISVSGSATVTVNNLFFRIASIIHSLNTKAESSNSVVKGMVARMKLKCDKYWGELEKMNVFFFIGTLLDPSSKFNSLKCALQRLYGEDTGLILALQVKSTAKRIFDEYRTMYAPPGPISEVGSAPIDTDFSGPIETDFMKLVKSDVRNENVSRGSLQESEFDRFLDEMTCSEYDVLTWWKLNVRRFPILARMTRDVLAIPVSTVPSESAFSTGGRTIDQFRSRLSPEMVQTLLCTQDWIRADIRSREMKENEWDELNQYIESEKLVQDMNQMNA